MIILLTIVLSLLANNLFRTPPAIRANDWLITWHHLVGKLFKKWPPVCLAVTLLLPLAPLFWLQLAIAEFQFSRLAFGTLMLWFAYGSYSFYRQSREFVEAWEKGDEAEIAQTLFSLSSKAPSTPAGQIGAALNATLERANENLFAFWFWFLVAGPVAAIGLQFLLILHLRAAQQNNGLTGTLVGILLWVPARLVAASYTIMGSFEDGIRGWKHKHDGNKFDLDVTNAAVVRAVGRGALREEIIEDVVTDIDRVMAARGLVLRSMCLWLGLIAAAFLVGWIG